MSEASRLVQSRTAQDIQGQEEESAGRGNSGSDNAKSIIFGGTDGLFHSLSLVAATAGANLSRNVVVVVGFATVAAGAVAMGTGEYLSSKAHKEFAQKEESREKRELKNDIDGRKKEVSLS